MAFDSASAGEWQRSAALAAAVDGMMIRRLIELVEMDAVELRLPSGMTILARRPDPLQLAALALDGAAETAGFSDLLLLFCCVAPRVSLTAAGEDEIHPWDIPPEDSIFIVRWAMRVAESLEGGNGVSEKGVIYGF
jgi:hypothetical protein